MTACTQCGRAHPMDGELCPVTQEPLDEVGLCGKQIDRYRIDQWIGGGGFGAVYRAFHVYKKRAVALKLLRLPRRADAKMIDRFFGEAQASDRIGSPHIVQVFDAGRTEKGDAFLAMELVEGCSLQDLLLAQSPLPMERAVRITLQIMSALDAAHAVGIVHRDIKPANVMLDGTDPAARAGRDFVKLVDFGISKIRDESQPMGEITQTGVAMGTPGYAAPEQYRSARDVDHRADIYATAVVLYRMLSGGLPFDAESFAELVIRVSTMDPPSLTMRAPTVAPVLAWVIDRALAREPSSRWIDMRQFAAALIEAYEGRAALASAPELAPFLAAIEPQRREMRIALSTRDANTLPSVTPTDMFGSAATMAHPSQVPPPPGAMSGAPSRGDSMANTTPRTPPFGAGWGSVPPAPAVPSFPAAYPHHLQVTPQPGQTPGGSAATVSGRGSTSGVGHAATASLAPSSGPGGTPQLAYPGDAGAPPGVGAASRSRRWLMVAVPVAAVLAVVGAIAIPRGGGEASGQPGQGAGRADQGPRPVTGTGTGTGATSGDTAQLPPRPHADDQNPPTHVAPLVGDDAAGAHTSPQVGDTQLPDPQPAVRPGVDEPGAGDPRTTKLRRPRGSGRDRGPGATAQVATTPDPPGPTPPPVREPGPSDDPDIVPF